MGLRSTGGIRLGSAGLARLVAAAAILASCGGGSSQPVSLFVTIEIPAGTAAPTELRVSVFDQREAIFVDQRLPATGALVPLSATTLGTATIYLLPTSAGARLDVRGLTGGQVLLRGTKAFGVAKSGQQAVSLRLSADPVTDRDGDGVPDPIDNCPASPNADQADTNGDGVGNACAPAGDAGAVDGGDAAREVGADATADSPSGADAVTDVAVDVLPDAADGNPGNDAATDAGADAAGDGSRDAGADAISDASTEAGSDAGPKPDAGPTGLLTIAPVATRTPVDLTAEGKIDWIHWGASSTSNVDHKASSSRRISDISPRATSRYTNAITTYAWSDGTPTVSTSTASGVYTNGNGATFTLTVPADTATATVRLYVGVSDVDGKLAARLSDDAAPATTFSTTGHAGNGGAAIPMEIKFRAASASQTLTLIWTPLNSTGGGYISINAATLF